MSTPPAPDASDFRARLLHGLERSIEERGYRDTTVADVVRLARTSRRTYYGVFQTKDQALQTLARRLDEELMRDLRTAVDRDADWRRQVVQAIEAYFAHVRRHPAATLCMIRELPYLGEASEYVRSSHDAFADVIQELADNTGRSGRARPSRRQALMIVSALDGLMIDLLESADDLESGLDLAIATTTAMLAARTMSGGPLCDPASKHVPEPSEYETVSETKGTPASPPVAVAPGPTVRHVGLVALAEDDRDAEAQRRALARFGCEPIVTEADAGQQPAGAALAAALDHLRPGSGDTLVTWSLDRLGHSLQEILVVLDQLRAHDARLRLLTGPCRGTHAPGDDPTSFFGVSAALVDLERTFAARRAGARHPAAPGRRHARTGRPTVMDDEKLKAAQVLRSRGQGPAQIAEALGISRATYYRRIPPASPPGE